MKRFLIMAKNRITSAFQNREGGSSELFKRLLESYSLTEIIIVMLIISVIVAITIGVTKAKLDSVITYTYYSGYGTLKNVARQMITDYNENDETYTSTLPVYLSEAQKKSQTSGFVKFFRNIKYSIVQSAYAANISTQCSCSAMCDYTNKKCYSAIGCKNCDPGLVKPGCGYTTESCAAQGGTLLLKPDGTCECRKVSIVEPSKPSGCSTFQKQLCQAQGKTINPYTCKCECNKTCSSGFTLNKDTCSCECNKTCSSGFTLNKNTCSCECNKTCSSGFTLNKNTCSCECNKTCPSGYTLNKSTCSCECNRTCPSGFTLNKNTCSCKCNKACPTGYRLDPRICSCKCYKTCPTGYRLDSRICSCLPVVIHCTGAQPCGKECDTTTGTWVDVPGFDKTCPANYTWDDESCGCKQTYFECQSYDSVNYCGLMCDHSTGNWVADPSVNKTCSSGFTWDNSTCGCVCNKTCPSGFVLDKRTCSCNCLKICSSGFTLNKRTCSCECNKTCSSGYTLDKNSCTCKQTYFECSGSQPCGKKCDHSTGNWVADPSVNKTCSSGFTWDNSTCGCVCNKTCPSGYKLNSSTCSCECNKTCSSGFTLNKNTCSCECNKTCSSGFTLNKNTCSCECNKTCSSGYTLDKNSCTCKQTYFECSGSQPCGKKCDHSTGQWVNDSSFSRSCPESQEWDENKCGCVLSYTGSQDTPKQCVGSKPCGKRCDTTTGNWVTDSSFSRSCQSGYKWDESSCSCKKTTKTCTKYSSVNYCGLKCDTSTGDWVKDDSVTKTCSSGYIWNESSCSCAKRPTYSCAGSAPCGKECNIYTGNWVNKLSFSRVCSHPFSWSEEKCKCVQTYFSCSGSAPCGKKCDTSTGTWVDDTSFLRACETGYKWDESSCGCVEDPQEQPDINDEPPSVVSECSGNPPSCCHTCNTATGSWVQKPNCPAVCDENKIWNDEKCACIQRPRTVPVSGLNFCEKFVGYTNTSPTLIDNAECHGDSIENNPTDFSNKKPDFVLRNGIRFYNVHSDPQPIPALANNSRGAQFRTPSGVIYDTNQTGYIVYVDVDGKSGDSKLYSDVYPFYVTMSGLVIPAYDPENSENSGGNSDKHLMASVRLEKISPGGRRTEKWLAKSVSFKEAACSSGYLNDATPYCAGVSLNNECKQEGSHCSLKIVRPIRFF